MIEPSALCGGAFGRSMQDPCSADVPSPRRTSSTSSRGWPRSSRSNLPALAHAPPKRPSPRTAPGPGFLRFGDATGAEPARSGQCRHRDGRCRHAERLGSHGGMFEGRVCVFSRERHRVAHVHRTIRRRVAWRPTSASMGPPRDRGVPPSRRRVGASPPPCRPARRSSLCPRHGEPHRAAPRRGVARVASWSPQR
jgi:hypothetical protein